MPYGHPLRLILRGFPVKYPLPEKPYSGGAMTSYMLASYEVPIAYSAGINLREAPMSNRVSCLDRAPNVSGAKAGYCWFFFKALVK